MPGRDNPGGSQLSRRHLLLGGAVGLTAAGAAAAAVASRPEDHDAPTPPEALFGDDRVPFHGTHQAGVATPPPAHVAFVALDLLAQTDATALARLMRILTDDAVRLTQGRGALADTEPELATSPARLTVTFGFGPGFVERAGAAASPSWLRPLPAFGIDRLEDRWSGGDLLLQVCADDPLTVAHAVRMLLKDSRTFTSLRWSQRGFRRAHGTEPATATVRNLFGQVDGTVNPAPGTDDFERLVWSHGQVPWLEGGTSLVLRRIAMDLDRWDLVDRAGRESAVGRRLDTGAPLTGVAEHDEPDFDAKTPAGFPVIADYSHLRRARSDDPGQKILRRAYNYDDEPGTDDGVSRSGLLFAAYQADVDAQFVPIQRRLDELDLLNEWTTPIGSAVFAIPPGCQADGFVGDTLLA
ncbi:Dyp-type peroxidase [Xylanimonas allomyrinae]|uniref:Dyp-type peroxidase n=1 Tax=Xylanimonas allomyrinae TaxID=2509459 RepID=A0A4P6EL18_9MICO|nr:Dyp-type peroxidase [Xylanimonas allomyrinae]QAY62886.1 Dyp-type peroxidase [Xylanimonas allomyrinae]